MLDDDVSSIVPPQVLCTQTPFGPKPSERHMILHELGMGGLFYGYSETVNEMFYIFI